MKREFFIAGVQFHNSDNVINDLKEGDILTLRPDPTNKYDPNAVQIIYNNNHTEDDCFLGFVPAKFSPEVAGALEIPLDIDCKITFVDAKAKPWERIQVLISEVEDA